MFSETVRLYLRGHRFDLAVLGELNFQSETMYVHNGAGLLRSKGFDGEIEDVKWKGLQGLARVSNLGPSKVGASRQVTASLDVTNQELRSTFPNRHETAGRRFRFWGQFYDDDAAPLDPRFHIYSGIGDRVRMRSSGPSTRTMELLLEDWIARRRRSANSMVTHSDQQSRDPGNTGFIFVQKMVDHTINLFDARN